MSDGCYILGAYFIGVSVGILLILWLEWFLKNYKRKEKVKTVQPQIEVYGKNYKKISEPGRTLNKTV